jgi:hypothetical protein
MKALNHFTISASESNRILKLQELKRMLNVKFDTTTLRTKVSAKRFKKANGLSLDEAPMAKIENGCIWKLVHFIGTSKKSVEKIKYVPMYQLPASF